MKDCRSALEALPLLLAGELIAGASADLQAHLESCPACAGELARQQRLDTLLRGAFARQPVDARAVQARVRHQIGEEAAARPPARSSRPGLATGVPWRKTLARLTPALFRPGPAFALAAVALLAVLVFLTFPAWQGGDPAVYAALAADHREDVVQRVKKTGWLRNEDAVREFTQSQFRDPALAAALAPEGSRLSRVRLSRLAGEDYAHFVYAGNDGRETVSFFVRARRNPRETLPGRPVEKTPDGRPLYAASAGATRLAGFQSSTLTVLVVSELPEVETMRVARSAAARLKT